MGDILGGLLKFQIFWGVLEIPDIFWGWTVDAGPEPMYEEKMKVPPLGSYTCCINKYGKKSIKLQKVKSDFLCFQIDDG